MRTIVMLLIAGALMTGRAAAQSDSWQPERRTAGWVFTPTMMVGGLSDSNVTLRNQGDPPLHDWVGQVGPRGELDYNGRHFRFNTGYSGTLEAYSSLPELNRFEQQSRVYSSYRATSRFTIEARASYLDTPSTDRLELGTLPFLDIGGRSFDAVGGVRLGLTPRTALAGDYRFQRLSFDESQRTAGERFLHDGYAHGPVASVSHAITRRFSVGGEWRYQHATMAGAVQEFDVQSTVGELSYKVAEHTSVNGGAGVAYSRVSATGISAWGPTFRAGLTHQLDRTSLSVTYDRSFVPSFGFGGLAGQQEFAATARAPLTRTGRLSASGSVGYSRAEPIEAIGIDYQLASLSTNANISYQVTRWLRTDGLLSITHQTTTARGNFNRTRVGIQFVTFKPVRIQ